MVIAIVTTCLGFNLVFLWSDDRTFLEFIDIFFMTVSMACFLGLFVYVFYSVNEIGEVKKKLSNLENKMDEMRRDLRRRD